MACINDGCLPLKEMRVEIDCINLYASDVNMTELKVEIESLAHVEGIDAGIELGDDGLVLRVIVLIDDETIGQMIVDAINVGDKSDYKALKRLTTARLKIPEPESLVLSEGRITIYDIFSIAISCMILLAN